MGLKPKAVTKFEPIEAGNHLAMCYGVVDLGTQETTYNNQTKFVHQVLLMFELTHERIEIDGKDLPRGVSKTYSMTLVPNKSKLYEDVTRWTKAPDAEWTADVLAGKACTLSIVNYEKDGQTRAAISGVGAPTKGMQIPAKPENAIVVYDLDNPDEAVFDKLPEWVQDKIMKSKEFGQNEEKVAGSGDDLPF